ncbi:long-chain N-acyl amino acid synthase [Paucibacter sp. B2R-40]|uniref:N-acyl amino acid synthase FeeM domain-containing protein n=1 Tax=Paucibacter sp. B2R-40 TaxID=2893554 RepID=UPI0021E515F0|nr:long-chain N-acyl amino acid synthase [Paucibacter sp. B2R-40]MCV2356468.1 long-chain N-acyl amino acid synthase [Paucibacter sp. B2R-40]
MNADTIIGLPFEAAKPLRSLLQQAFEPAVPLPSNLNQRLFKIRSADSDGQRSSASILVNRMYAWRGYNTAPVSAKELPLRITLLASEEELTIGTITIGFDSPAGLSADDPFALETAELRARGLKLCEFTQLAVDSVVRSKRVLASLFHVAYIFAHRMMGFDSLLIEVNPRHVRFYEGMLGFKVLGLERLNPRVNAPAVLMSVDFDDIQRQIGLYGGRPELSLQARSLYPYMFSVAEEASIVGRLKRTQPDAAFAHVPLVQANASVVEGASKLALPPL